MPVPIPDRAPNRERLNESPSEKEGKYQYQHRPAPACHCLNESPSEKEGKC